MSALLQAGTSASTVSAHTWYGFNACKLLFVKANTLCTTWCVTTLRCAALFNQAQLDLLQQAQPDLHAACQNHTHHRATPWESQLHSRLDVAKLDIHTLPQLMWQSVNTFAVATSYGTSGQLGSAGTEQVISHWMYVQHRAVATLRLEGAFATC